MMKTVGLLCLSVAFFWISETGAAGETLHEAIDRLVLARANGRPASPPADDAEFLRRVFLDFAGKLPAAPETPAFPADGSPDKRPRLIDRLLGGPDYARRMQDVFHVMLMERLGDHPEWSRYLYSSFRDNKPWDQMAREILG